MAKSESLMQLVDLKHLMTLSMTSNMLSNMMLLPLLMRAALLRH